MINIYTYSFYKPINNILMEVFLWVTHFKENSETSLIAVYGLLIHVYIVYKLIHIILTVLFLIVWAFVVNNAPFTQAKISISDGGYFSHYIDLAKFFTIVLTWKSKV